MRGWAASSLSLSSVYLVYQSPLNSLTAHSLLSHSLLSLGRFFPRAGVASHRCAGRGARRNAGRGARRNPDDSGGAGGSAAVGTGGAAATVGRRASHRMCWSPRRGDGSGGGGDGHAQPDGGSSVVCVGAAAGRVRAGAAQRRMLARATGALLQPYLQPALAERATLE